MITGQNPFDQTAKMEVDDESTVVLYLKKKKYKIF